MKFMSQDNSILEKNVDNGIFPDVFLKVIDKSQYRDNKIDEIL